MSSLWLSNKDIFKNISLNSCLCENISSDVCIIGAGIFGLTCGYYLSKLGYNVSILEKDKISSKVTGNTTRKDYKWSWFVL